MADVPKDITAAAQGAVDRMPELKAMIDPGEFWELVQREVEAALLSERERRTAQGVTPEIVEALCSSPIIEALTPTVYEMSACQAVQDEYNLMKQRIRKAFAAPSLSTSAGGGE